MGTAIAAKFHQTGKIVPVLFLPSAWSEDRADRSRVSGSVASDSSWFFSTTTFLRRSTSALPHHVE